MKNSWYKRYPGHFLNGCIALTLDEKGAYSVVLDLIYDRGGPIPDDSQWIARVCGCSTRRWNQLRSRLIEVGKLKLVDGLLTNLRAEKELKNAGKMEDKLEIKSGLSSEKTDEKQPNSPPTNDLTPGTRDEITPPPASASARAFPEAQKPREEIKQQLPSVVPIPREPRMPRIGDPGEAWRHLADEMRVEEDKRPNTCGPIKRPIVRGVYLDLAGESVCDAAGIDPARTPIDWRPLAAWLREGLEILDILAAVKRVASRANYQPPRSLAYFDQAVRERKARIEGT